MNQAQGKYGEALELFMLGLGIMRKCYGTSHPQVLAMVKNVKMLKMLKRAMVSNTGLPNASPVPASDLAARFGTLSFSPSAGGRVGKFGTVTEENIDIVSEHTSSVTLYATLSMSLSDFDSAKRAAYIAGVAHISQRILMHTTHTHTHTHTTHTHTHT